jgi:hypothetical protein
MPEDAGTHTRSYRVPNAPAFCVWEELWYRLFPKSPVVLTTDFSGFPHENAGTVPTNI